MSLVAVIGTRLDVYSLFYAAWLCYFYNRERRGIARVWKGFVIFITILIPLQYLMCVGIPPGICTGKKRNQAVNYGEILVLGCDLYSEYIWSDYLICMIYSVTYDILCSSALPYSIKSFMFLPVQTTPGLVRWTLSWGSGSFSQTLWNHRSRTRSSVSLFGVFRFFRYVTLLGTHLSVSISLWNVLRLSLCLITTPHH